LIHQYVWVLQLIGIAFLIRLIDEAPVMLRSWALRSLSGDVTQPTDDDDYEELAQAITRQLMYEREAE